MKYNKYYYVKGRASNGYRHFQTRPHVRVPPLLKTLFTRVFVLHKCFCRVLCWVFIFAPLPPRHCRRIQTTGTTPTPRYTPSLTSSFWPRGRTGFGHSTYIINLPHTSRDTQICSNLAVLYRFFFCRQVPRGNFLRSINIPLNLSLT